MSFFWICTMQLAINVTLLLLFYSVFLNNLLINQMLTMRNTNDKTINIISNNMEIKVKYL